MLFMATPTVGFHCALLCNFGSRATINADAKDTRLEEERIRAGLMEEVIYSTVATHYGRGQS